MKQSQDSVTFIQEKSKEGEDWQTLRQVQINRSFFKGFQWISWDKVQKRVFVPDLRPGEKRYTYNKIKPKVLTLLAKLCKNRVKLEVRPDTNDIDRLEIAKAGLKYLHYQWQKDDMDRKTRRMRMHMLVDGFPALKVYVDKTQGDDLPASFDKLDENDLKGLDLNKLPSKTGKICTVVCDQLSLKVDPSAEDVTEIRWAMEERPTDVDEIMEEWGKEVAPQDNISMRQSFDFNATQDQQKRFKNHAIVYDYWEMPGPNFPNGRRIVVAGDKELLKDENDPGEFPFVFFPAVPIPGKAIGDGIVTDMTTPQRSFNIKRTAEARILEEMGNPMWMVPTGSVPDMNDLTNEIGGFVEFTSINGAEPKRVQGVSVDQGWQNALERDERDMEDISGAHEISQGAPQKGNDTLGGLQLQVEQDETKLAILVQSYEDGCKEWGNKVLKLIKRYFPEEQQLSIVGETGEIEAFTFNGAELEDVDLSVDVIPGSSMPTMKVAEDQKVMQMWGAGMFNDPKTGLPDTRKVMRMLGQSVAADYFDDTEQDENKALTENRMWQMAFKDEKSAQALIQYSTQLQAYQTQQQQLQQMQQQGMDVSNVQMIPQPQPPVKLPAVRDFYDQQTHIDTHNRYRKSDDYDDLDPALQWLIDQHVLEHQQAGQGAPDPQAQAMQAQQQADQQKLQLEQQKLELSHKQNQDKLQLDAQKVALDHQSKQTQAQLAAMKTQAEMQRTAAQFNHEKEMAGINQAHDWNKTLVAAQSKGGKSE